MGLENLKIWVGGKNPVEAAVHYNLDNENCILAIPFEDKTGPDVKEKYRRWLWEKICEKNEEVIYILENLLNDVSAFSCDFYLESKFAGHGEVIASCLRWMEPRYVD
jgi:hypothetical protein